MTRARRRGSRRAIRPRQPGRPAGHAGHTRVLVPVDAVAILVPCQAGALPALPAPVVGRASYPRRHRMTDIPPAPPVVTAYQLYPLRCSVYGEVPPAEWPTGVPTGGCGRRAQAVAALCTGTSHLSKRTTQRGLKELCGVSVAVGTRAHLEPAPGAALAPSVAEARGFVPAHTTAYGDATGGREGRARAWLWVAMTTWVMVCVVRLSRCGQVAQALMGARCWGDRVTDRWRAYTGSPTWGRQVCWAHRLRDIEAMSARWGLSRHWGGHQWPISRDGPLVASGTQYHPGACQLCSRYAAERASRPGVLGRKGRVDTPGPEGSRVVEMLLTVVATLKQQPRHVRAYITAAREAALHGEAAPALLPIPALTAQPLSPSA
jgi:transposase